MSDPDTTDWGQPLTPERHHYWPECVSNFWKDTDGRVIRLAWDETELWSPPKNFGVIKDGHRMKEAPPWDTSIESMFGNADSNFPAVISWLQSLVPVPQSPDLSMGKRIKSESCSEETIDSLGECLASIVVRSPAFRSKILLELIELRKMVRPGGMPFRDKQESHNLIVGNLSTHYTGAIQLLQRKSTKFLVLICPDSEFVFSEGFLNDIYGIAPATCTRCLVPLTPHVAVAAYRFQSSSSGRRVYSIDICPAETDLINEVSQIYTKDYIYFRMKKPRVFPAFTQRSFLEVPDSRVPMIEEFGEVVRLKVD
jgi:hypothetical protein